MDRNLEPHHLKGIQASLDYAESQLALGPVKAAEMAWQACMSPFHFDRIFRRTLGITPGAYVRQRRISEAASRIIASPEPVARVGLELGYGSAEAFSRSFKGQFFLAPGELRDTGILPYLLATPMRVPAAAEPSRPGTRVRHVQVPHRLCVGLFRRGANVHEENMQVDYELLRRAPRSRSPDSWLYFDRTHPGTDLYEMFLGWEVRSLTRIPQGLEPLEIPSHPALLVTHTGYLDSTQEVEVRAALLHRLSADPALEVDPSRWKLTRSRPCPDSPGYRQWTLEIALR